MSTVEKKKVISPLAQIKELEQDPKLLELCAQHLPSNYDFEIAKTVWRIRKTANCSTVALQMPEGLLLFATKVANVLSELTGVDTILMGDVTYGACCIDDFTASMLGAQLLVHYGHSCLVPTSVANRIETIYIFVTIKYNIDHAVEAIGNLLKDRESEKINGVNSDSITRKTNASPEKGRKRRHHVKITSEPENQQDSQDIEVIPSVNVSLVSTIQFANSLPIIKSALENCERPLLDSNRKVQVTIPRSKPLSNGEILGCTAPTVKDDVIVYVGDGRFHLEAMMMANPSIDAYRYDPYNKTITLELFDHEALHTARGEQLASLQRATKRLCIGIILGTLGRQGNPTPLDYVYQQLSTKHDCFVVLMSEVIPAKLELFKGVDVWVQFACPRLSIDWGSAFSLPILTPYEAIWGLQSSNNFAVPTATTSTTATRISTEDSNCCQIGQGDSSCCRKEGSLGGEVDKSSCCDNSNNNSTPLSSYTGHPMDYYAYDSRGPHTPNFMPPAPPKPRVKIGK